MTSVVKPLNLSKTDIVSNQELAIALKEALMTDGVYAWGEEMTDDIFVAPVTVDLDENENSSISGLGEIASSSAADSGKLQEWIESIENLYGDAKAGEIENTGLQMGMYLNHKYPLHFAASEGNIEALEYLLTEADINVRDKLDSTPLHVAIISNQQVAVEYLVAQGADINALAYEEYSPLALAIHKQNFEAIDYLMNQNTLEIDDAALWFAFELLITTVDSADEQSVSELHHILNLVEGLAARMDVAIFEEEDYNFSMTELRVDSIPISLILELQAAETKNPIMSDMLLQSAKNIQMFDSSHEIFIQTKLLTHIFALDGGFEVYYPIQGSENYYTSGIDAEGLFGIYTVQAAKQYIELYMEKNNEALSPIQLRSFEHLQQTLSQSLSLSQASRNDEVLNNLFEQFQQGETILIPTGWEGHFVVTIIDGKNGYFVTSNTGQAYENLDSGSIVYKMHHPERITPELLEKIANNEAQFDLEYDLFYELGLEEVAVLPAPHQTVGNCGWRSIEVAVEAFTYLELLDEGYASNEAADLAHQWYQDWFDFTQISFLTEYLENNQNIDPNLIDTLAQKYPAFFPEVEQNTDANIDNMVNDFEYQLLMSDNEFIENRGDDIIFEDIIFSETSTNIQSAPDLFPIIVPEPIIEHNLIEQPVLIEGM